MVVSRTQEVQVGRVLIGLLLAALLAAGAIIILRGNGEIAAESTADSPATSDERLGDIARSQTFERAVTSDTAGPQGRGICLANQGGALHSPT